MRHNATSQAADKQCKRRGRTGISSVKWSFICRKLKRLLQWFDHYLKGADAPRWITHGVSVIERNDEIERIKR